MVPQPRSELQELVDAPNETLAVEYKNWFDLNENAGRADLARQVFGIRKGQEIVGPSLMKILDRRHLAAANVVAIFATGKEEPYEE